MLKFLRRHSGLRSVAANAAAFVFALQLMLAGLIATQMAANAAAGHATLFELCYGAGTSSDDGTSTKVFHQTCAVCTLASAAPPLPQTFAAAPAVFTGVFVRTEVRVALLTGESRREPRTSQGPPQTA